MALKLTRRRVTRELPDYDEVRALMERAFPPEEQVDFDELMERTAEDGVEFTAYYDAGAFCGFAYTIEAHDLVYVLFLAVDDRLRSRGYGSAIINEVKDIADGRPLYLDIEPVVKDAENLEQRTRRLAFYEGCGFHDTGISIVDEGMTYWLLTTDEAPASGTLDAIAGIVGAESVDVHNRGKA